MTHQIGLEGVAGLLAEPPRDYLKAAVVAWTGYRLA